MARLLARRSPRSFLALVPLLLLALFLLGPTCAGPQVAEPAITPTPEETVAPAGEPRADSGQPAGLSTWNEIIVKPEQGVTEAQLQAALDALAGSEVALRPSVVGRFLATFPPTQPPRDEADQEALALAAGELAEVAEALPNKRIDPAGRG
jgi:hypothetical protein